MWRNAPASNLSLAQGLQKWLICLENSVGLGFIQQRWKKAAVRYRWRLASTPTTVRTGQYYLSAETQAPVHIYIHLDELYKCRDGALGNGIAYLILYVAGLFQS